MAECGVCGVDLEKMSFKGKVPKNPNLCWICDDPPDGFERVPVEPSQLDRIEAKLDQLLGHSPLPEV